MKVVLPIFKIAIFIFVVFFSFSCSKDSDLLAEYVLSDDQNAIAIRNFVVNDTYFTSQENSVVLDVLSNDTFNNPEEVNIIETSTPSNGDVLINEDETLTYTPTTEITEETIDTFTYTTEVVNEDATVSNETGTVTIKLTDLGELKAFPGAEGFAKYATGGRGGEVIEVTNLNDSGSGSFRAACEAKSTRTIVFKVAGTIALNSRIDLGAGNVTIAGITASRNGGGGITLRQGNPYGEALFSTGANSNIIIRDIRFRRGPGLSLENNGDAFITLGGSNIIIDHCSFSWGTDEVVNFNYSSNVSFQNCIVSEGLNNSVHNRPHSKGLFIYRCDNVSTYANAMVHNADRNGFIGGDSEPGENFEFGNNITYNYGGFGMIMSDNSDPYNVNLFYNKWKRGPDSSSSRYAVGIQEDTNCQYYVEGNIDDLKRTSTGQDEWDVVGDEATLGLNASEAFRAFSPFPFPMENLAFVAANDIETQLLPNMGARPRDAVDVRIASDIANGTGTIIDHPNDVGGWPSLSAMSIVPEDSDKDGISDSWESSNGLDPNNGTDGKEDDNDNGYTNLEEYLEFLALLINP